MRDRLAGILGNILEHYDKALFGLLAPFIAPLFFESSDPITALILIYGIMPLGMLARPLGSLFFGRIGDRYGRRQALSYSLVGMAVVTVGIGLLPLYRDIGLWAPICLASARMLQEFFSAGETSGGAIFLLEDMEPPKRSFMSSFYDASSIGGILIASAAVASLSLYTTIEDTWRYLYWVGGLTALLGVLLRIKGIKENSHQETPEQSWSEIFIKHRSALISIILVSGFTYATYSLAFTLMNGYVPLVTSFTKADLIQVNTLLLAIDMLLLPVFGYLASVYGKEKVMLFGSLSSAATAVPLFMLLQHSTLSTIIFVRLMILLFGVAFAAPYHAWTIERVPKECRYSILSLGYALGSQLIGAPTAAACLWFYKKTEWAFAPGIYIIVIALAASYAVYRTEKDAQAYASN